MPAPEIRGWCPGALRPMASGDGLVVRIRPRLGRLSPDEARGIARLARDCGSGLIDLSARANLQLRGVRDEAHPALIDGLRALGLVDIDAAMEARRNITVTPFWRAGDAAPRIAAALEAALAVPDAPALPGKFGFAVDTGAIPVLRDTSADIRVECAPDGALVVRADGMDRGMAVREDEAAPAMIDLARWFLASGGAPAGRGRMRRHINAGAVPPPAFRTAAIEAAQSFIARPGLTETGALVALAFGQIRAETFESLAGAGAPRLTPWRMLVIEDAATMPDLPGVITVPDDPLLRVIACTGAPGCTQARQPTRDLARALATLIPPDGLLHVSGCAKGCAHPLPAPLTLVGTAGGFDLVRDGTAAAPPVASGLPADAARIAGVFDAA